MTAAALLSTIPSLQVIAVGVVVVASAVLGWLLVRQGRRGHPAEGIRGTPTPERGSGKPPEAGVADAQASGGPLRSIIDSAVDGIVVIDQAGRIESFNPAAERLFGYPRTEVVGRNVSMLMPSPYHEEHDGYLHRHLTTGTARIIGTGREVTCRRRTAQRSRCTCQSAS